jgi:hypothetical protein
MQMFSAYSGGRNFIKNQNITKSKIISRLAIIQLNILVKKRMNIEMC